MSKNFSVGILVLAFLYLTKSFAMENEEPKKASDVFICNLEDISKDEGGKLFEIPCYLSKELGIKYCAIGRLTCNSVPYEECHLLTYAGKMERPCNLFTVFNDFEFVESSCDKMKPRPKDFKNMVMIGKNQTLYKHEGIDFLSLLNDVMIPQIYEDFKKVCILEQCLGCSVLVKDNWNTIKHFLILMSPEFFLAKSLKDVQRRMNETEEPSGIYFGGQDKIIIMVMPSSSPTDKFFDVYMIRLSDSAIKKMRANLPESEILFSLSLY